MKTLYDLKGIGYTTNENVMRWLEKADRRLYISDDLRKEIDRRITISLDQFCQENNIVYWKAVRIINPNNSQKYVDDTVLKMCKILGIELIDFYG